MYTLSGGQKSRVAFAKVTFSKPHILLLDEPSNHLDLDAVNALIQVGLSQLLQVSVHACGHSKQRAVALYVSSKGRRGATSLKGKVDKLKSVTQHMSLSLHRYTCPALLEYACMHP